MLGFLSSKGTTGHAISFDLDPIKRCRISGADRLLDCFKYILLYNQAEPMAEIYTHDPRLMEKLELLAKKHRGLVSGSFRTLTGRTNG